MDEKSTRGCKAVKVKAYKKINIKNPMSLKTKLIYEADLVFTTKGSLNDYLKKLRTGSLGRTSDIKLIINISNGC